jgi:histidine triad (HIT) family protein
MSLVAHMIEVARELARKEGISESGYRLMINCREDGGQTVMHLHLHLLGGEKICWGPA